MTQIKWGILSGANIAYDQLVPALRRSGHGFVTAVASKNKGKAERFQVPEIYERYDALLKVPYIDAVYIPLPNALHAEWAVKAMNHGKHVLLEKPAALTEAEMVAIKEAADKNDVVFMEAFMYQFHKQHERVKELLESEVIGEWRHVKAHFSWMLDNDEDIRLSRELGGGAMRDVGCYGIHAVTQIVGFRPANLSMTARIPSKYGVDITSTCVMADENGRTAEIFASMEMPFINRYEIIGSKGSITVDSSFRPDESSDGFGKVTVRDSNYHVILLERHSDDQYLNQVEHFHECILKNKQPAYNAAHSVDMARYLEKSYESLENNSILVNVG
ncbi:Gfo/Idh/MocA family protein [Fictibacillus terranigra]|uniref:Gfo/Idh/MocA family oxidoreductase n=1 Tax=Fictibacillus terranigra TaxID=3058424 RepID=A0ABT8E7M4_9BACL|nr:Gfo/Idh/MocA family oxidoreductase [Fictibacillus sp. CENA-BCM004]MDN4073891.1 Gfo/Idh/MocA family oxidoreductase [Fictibacillus sp. CENA-BCM004]